MEAMPTIHLVLSRNKKHIKLSSCQTVVNFCQETDVDHVLRRCPQDTVKSERVQRYTVSVIVHMSPMSYTQAGVTLPGETKMGLGSNFTPLTTMEARGAPRRIHPPRPVRCDVHTVTAYMGWTMRFGNS